MPVLRETGASLDIGFEKCASPEMFTGHLDGEKYFLENQTIEFLEPDLEQNGLPRPDIGNEMQTRRERRKEAEKSICLENENDQFRLRGSVVEIGKDFVHSLTGEGTNNGNLVKLSACEIIEAQLRSEESAHLIWRTSENGTSDEASDQEGASMQLIPVRHKVSTELYIDAIGPLPIVPIRDKYILPDMCMSPRYHEAVPLPEKASTPLVEALLQIFRRVFPKEIQTDEYFNYRVV
ncbi:uncharacterized protein TNCV_2384991 [Trichonephila clavipes]|nr:uncharacterized protein TNCV_2384991 [Trichonephila clavipes]